LEKVSKEVIRDLILNNDLELKSTHKKLCVPIINRIYKKMSAGINFSGIKVEENLICDGHHRYIASLLANFPIDRIPSIITSATKVIEWESVIFEENDWDTTAKINMLNEEDANYNNIPIEKIIQILQ
jgi:hypothetical protein